jgi:putative membrane protein
MRHIGLLCVAASILATSSCSNTERTRPSTQERAGAVGAGGAGANLRSDADFIQDVAIKNMAAMELSRMAMGKAASSDIKSFAQGAFNHADAAALKLRDVGEEPPSGQPTALDDEQRENVDELARAQGADFDREYLEAMIERYQDLTAKLESRLDVQSLAAWKTAAAARAPGTALTGPDMGLPDVKVRPDRAANERSAKINQWAADTYPGAQKQLAAARTLQNALKGR